MTRILFSNLGYARGIDGTLPQLIKRFYRFIYCRQAIQKDILNYLKTMMNEEDPDLCCFVEIHQGGRFVNKLNQLHSLVCDKYPHFDIANKYGEDNPVRYLPFHRGRSNGFMAKQDYRYKHIYFKHGTKRLIYEITLDNNRTILFTHFSLNAYTRARQFKHIAEYVNQLDTEVILLADFNIFQGFIELDDFIKDTGLVILNNEANATFTLHKKRLALDLCLCSPVLANKAKLKIIDQPFSDHDALLVEF
jgi:hypothetical protein